MSEAVLQSVLARLEQATARLEMMSGTASAAAGSSSGAIAGTHPSLTAFDELISAPLATFIEKSKQVGGLVEEQAQRVAGCFAISKQIIQVALASKKPAQQQLMTVIAPLQKKIEEIQQIKEKNRPSPLSFHLSSIADGIPALGWIVVDPTPAPYVSEMKDAAQFYANKVIKEYKEK
jgi:adenylyl cyclase-associated protein